MALSLAGTSNIFDNSRTSGFGLSYNKTSRHILEEGTYGLVPIGSITAWCKTFGVADSGNCDGIGATANVLKDSGQNFTETVAVGMIVRNETNVPKDFTTVTSVTSDTALAVADDIFDDGDDYTIFKITELPDGWLECDGSVIDDYNSPLNGETLPDLNGSNQMLRGNTDGSGRTGGNATHNHQWKGSTTASYDSGGGLAVTVWQTANPAGGATRYVVTSVSPNAWTNKIDGSPPYYEVVWIMRIK